MTYHHSAAFAVVIGFSLTLLAISLAAQRLAGMRSDHAVLRAGMGLAGLTAIPFIILTIEALING